MRKWLRVKSSATKSLSITPVYFRYNTITLKLFLEVAQTSEYKKILISGEATVEDCARQWETILEQHNYHCGNADHDNFKIHLQAYRALMQKFVTVRTSLLYILFDIDQPTIDWLNKEGYKIDVDHGYKKYCESWERAFNKSNNLNSKQKQKLNQINTFKEAVISARKEYNDGQEANGFEERVAAISFYLGFHVEDDVTLARYNNYVKLVNKQQQQQQQQHGTRA
jgi:hypothetical protein